MEIDIVFDWSLEDYYDCYGKEYENGELWDFSEDDFLSRAVEPSSELVYYYIDGRFYEGYKN